MGFASILHPDDESYCSEMFFSAFSNNEIFEAKCRLRRSDGVYRYVTRVVVLLMLFCVVISVVVVVVV